MSCRYQICVVSIRVTRWNRVVLKKCYKKIIPVSCDSFFVPYCYIRNRKDEKVAGCHISVGVYRGFYRYHVDFAPLHGRTGGSGSVAKRALRKLRGEKASRTA